jgi:enoyl-CoA hydratase/carnithine racemase
MPLAEVVRMSLMGNDERISAETALRISLVTEIAERDALWTRAHEIAAIIAAKPAAAIQGSVRAIWEAQDLPRSAAVSNALKYCQLGNPIGRAEVDRWSVPKARWKLR